MIPLSVVISAPKGLFHCLGLQTFLADKPGHLEVIVVDGAEGATEQKSPNLRHVLLPGASVFELRRAGLREAGTDWILLTEDHCRPLPGLLQAYRAAIQHNPDIDLISGALTNDTSTSPWEWASFLLFRHEFWPPSGKIPDQPAIGNLLVRRGAILDSELACRGGFDCATIPRLAQHGRYMHCRDAIVDHVEHLNCMQMLAGQFHSARAGASLARDVARTSLLACLLRLLVVPVNRTFVVPLRVARDLRGTPQGHWSLLPRLMTIGFASTAGWLLGCFSGPGNSELKVT